MKKDDFEDDGRTIADMTGVGGPSLFGRKKEKKNEGSTENPRPWEDHTKDTASKEEGRAAMKGALAASLLIWLVYAVCFGIVIVIMVLLSKKVLG